VRGVAGGPVDERVARAGALLAERGIAGEVSVEGHQAEIAALRVAGDSWERVAGEEGAALVDELKALGFRYVALDLEAGG
jgi:PP-loop superfamily ATP-utilizing enzyme